MIVLLIICIIVVSAFGVFVYFRDKQYEKRMNDSIEWLRDIRQKTQATSDPDELLELRHSIKMESHKYIGSDPQVITAVLNLLIRIDRKLDKLSV